MDIKIFSSFFLLNLTILLCNVEALQRPKRYLLFPQANPTRHQFVFGVGSKFPLINFKKSNKKSFIIVPLDLPQISVVSGYVLRGVYYVPYNVQHLVPMFLKNETILAEENWTRLNRTDFVRRKRDITPKGMILEEKHDEYKKLNEQSYNSRWTFYDILIGAIGR